MKSIFLGGDRYGNNAQENRSCTEIKRDLQGSQNGNIPNTSRLFSITI